MNRTITPFLVTILFFSVLFSSIAIIRHIDYYTFEVSGKERQCDSTSDNKVNCYYVVFGKDGEVFQNTDSVWYAKWNSGSIQARLQEGHTYKVKTSGYRIPFLSMKPNIIKIEE